MRSYLLVMLVAGEVLAQGRPEVPAHIRNQSVRTRTLTVTGTARLETVSVTNLDAGTAAVDQMTVRGNLGVDGGTVLAGDAGVGGNLTVAGTMEAQGDLGTLGVLYGDEVFCASAGENCVNGPGGVQMGGRGWFYSGVRAGLGNVTPTVEIEDGVGTARIFVGGAGSPAAIPLALAGRNDAGVAVAGPIMAQGADDGGLVLRGVAPNGPVRVPYAAGIWSPAHRRANGYGESTPLESVVLPCPSAEVDFGTRIRWAGAYGGENWECTELSFLLGGWGAPHNAVQVITTRTPIVPGGPGSAQGVEFVALDDGTHNYGLGAVLAQVEFPGTCVGGCPTGQQAHAQVFQYNHADAGFRLIAQASMPCVATQGTCVYNSAIYPGPPGSSGCSPDAGIYRLALPFEEGGPVALAFASDAGSCSDYPIWSFTTYGSRIMLNDGGGG